MQRNFSNILTRYQSENKHIAPLCVCSPRQFVTGNN